MANSNQKSFSPSEAVLCAAAFGLFTSVAMSWIRGGVADAPWIAAVFSAIGFVPALAIAILCHPRSVSFKRKLFAGTETGKSVSTVVAFLVATSAVYWAGPFIRGFGFGGWVVGCLLNLLLPLAICVLASGWWLFLGCWAASCVTASLIIADASWSREHGVIDYWGRFLDSGWHTWLLIWLISVGISLVASVPFRVFHSRSGKGRTKPAEGEGVEPSRP